MSNNLWWKKGMDIIDEAIGDTESELGYRKA